MLSPCFIPESVFYTQSVMLSPRFIPESVFYTQSVVRSPQSLFYTDRLRLRPRDCGTTVAGDYWHAIVAGCSKIAPNSLQEILCGLSLADFTFQELDLNSPFLSTTTIASIIHSWIAQKKAAVHQHGKKRKNSQQLFFNIASWSHFFCHGSVNTAKQGEDGFLICCHFLIAV